MLFRSIFCEKAGEVIKLDPARVSGMIERIHRGKPPKNNGPRVIHAKLFNWNHVELIKNEWWKHGKDSHVYIDQRYGPDTTWRRNKALEMRRSLKANKEIVAGYVQYPAKLLVKYRATDRKYQLHHDFSREPIPLPVIATE